MAKKQQEKCSFCGAKADEVEKLIASPEAMICDECIFSCMETLVYGEKLETIELEVEEDDETEVDPNSGC